MANVTECVLWDSFSATLLHRRDDAFLFPLNYLDGEIPRSSIFRDPSLRTAAVALDRRPGFPMSTRRARRAERCILLHSPREIPARMPLYFLFVRGATVARGLPRLALAVYPRKSRDASGTRHANGRSERAHLYASAIKLFRGVAPDGHRYCRRRF